MTVDISSNYEFIVVCNQYYIIIGYLFPRPYTLPFSKVPGYLFPRPYTLPFSKVPVTIYSKYIVNYILRDFI